MNDFKIGDKAWFFRTEIYDIVLSTGIIQQMKLERVKMRRRTWVLFTFDDWMYLNCIFKSKSEAIDAMIKRLQDLKNKDY